jgi:hypothetical protein
MSNLKTRALPLLAALAVAVPAFAAAPPDFSGDWKHTYSPGRERFGGSRILIKQQGQKIRMQRWSATADPKLISDLDCVIGGDACTLTVDRSTENALMSERRCTVYVQAAELVNECTYAMRADGKRSEKLIYGLAGDGSLKVEWVFATIYPAKTMIENENRARPAELFKKQ